MEIAGFTHKGLRLLYEEDDASRVDAATVDKLRLMLAFLQDMASPEELRAPPRWKAHLLTGARKGVWSLHVTRNWRLTFSVDAAGALQNLNLEDYH